MMSTTPVISAKITGLFRGDVQILGPIELEVMPGETVAISGLSGIGKTTLLRALAGLEPGLEGDISVSRLGVVFQEPTLLPWRRTLDNVTRIVGCTQDRASAALREVDLAGKESHFPGQLSLGQQRRLSLARVVAGAPEVVLLDEPFVSLDADLVEDMIDLVANLQAEHGFACVLVTHSAHEAERLADRQLRLAGKPAVLQALS